MKKSAALLSILLLPSLLFGQETDTSPVVVHRTTGDYELIVETVREAIIGRGMVISGTLHVSEMLDRTAGDLGFSGQPYAKAESIEFCSALLSQRMTRADARNIVICPFTVAVYIPVDEPEAVYVAFRRPALAGEAREVEQAVFDLLDGIARESVE